MKSYLASFDGFIILIKSNFEKIFGFFIPSNLNSDKQVIITLTTNKNNHTNKKNNNTVLFLSINLMHKKSQSMYTHLGIFSEKLVRRNETH